MTWILATVVVAALSAVSAQATVFLSDTFNSTQPANYYRNSTPGVNPEGDGLGDWGVNQELATRQSGPLATAGYNYYAPANSRIQVNGSAAPGALALVTYPNGGGDSYGVWACPNRDFSSDATVSADLRADVLNSDATGWVALGMRGNFPNQGAKQNLADGSVLGAFIKVQEDGAWEFRENDGLVSQYTTSGSVATASSFHVSMRAIGDQITASINGVALDLNGASLGLTRTITTPEVLQNTQHNYVYVNGYQFLAGDIVGAWSVDNLTVSSIPEPGTLTMLTCGIFGLLAYVWRRRK
jgi:hypothetical protein